VGEQGGIPGIARGEKVQADVVRTGLKVNESFEVGVANRPACRGEAALVVVNCYRAVLRLCVWVANLAVYQQDLLVYLFHCEHYPDKSLVESHTHDPSVIERILGARGEVIWGWDDPLRCNGLMLCIMRRQ